MALRQTKFSQYFALYPAGQDSDILADAMISRIRLDKRAKKMEVTLHLSALTERVRLDKVAAQISALYGIEKVWINPCFPPDSFTEDFWEEVKNEVKRQNRRLTDFLRQHGEKGGQPPGGKADTWRRYFFVSGRL